MDTSAIEERGVTLITMQLNYTNKIKSFIEKHDKKPLWDGDIFIYSTEKFTNNNLIGRLHTQVKTNNVSKYTEYINIDQIALDKYSSESGIVYFNVQINRDKHRIYYSILTKLELERYKKQKGKKAKVRLYILPEGNNNKIYNIFKDAVISIKDNSKTLDNVLSFNDSLIKYPGGSIKFSIKMPLNASDNEILKCVNDQNPYIYYKPPGIDDYFVVDKFGENFEFNLLENKKIKISIDNEIIFKSAIRKQSISETTILFGKYLKFVYKNDKLNLGYSINGTLEDRIKTLSVANKIINNQKISINDVEVQLGQINIPEDNKNNVALTLQIYKMIDKCLSHLSIKKEINFELLDINQINQFNILYNALFNKKPIKCNDKYQNWIPLNICDIRIILYQELIDDETAYVYNFFDSNKNIVKFYEDKQISSYLIIAKQFPRENMLKLFDNINYMTMKKEVCNKEINDDRYPSVCNQLVLALIDYYDYCLDEESLNTALEILMFIENNYNSMFSNYLLINKYQIYYRLKQLKENDIMIITKLKNESDNNITKFACSLILNNKNDSIYFYNILTREEKEFINNLPIIHLYK